MKKSLRASVAVPLLLALLLFPARTSWGLLGDMQMRGSVTRTQGVHVGGATGGLYPAGHESRALLSLLAILLDGVIKGPDSSAETRALALELASALEAVQGAYVALDVEERLDRLARKHKKGGVQVADDGYTTDASVLEDFRELVGRRLTLSGPTPAASPHMGPAALLPFVQLRLKLVRSLGGGVDADQGDQFGLSVYSPYAPQQIGARHTAFAVAYQYWPYNRAGDEHVDDYGSGVYDLSADWGITDAVALGVSLPYIAQANSPDGAALERETGVGDPAFRLDWWLTQRWQEEWLGHAGLQFQVRAPWGSEDVAATESEPARQGTSFGSTQFGIALRTSIAPRTRFVPRVHTRLGYQWTTSDEVNGFGEVVVGAVWNVDPWRAKDATPGDRRWNVGAWLDFAGTYKNMAEALGDADPAWEWRAGVGYIRTGGPFGTGAGRRHMFTLEVQGGIDSAGLHSHPVSVQLGYGFTLERSR